MPGTSAVPNNTAVYGSERRVTCAAGQPPLTGSMERKPALVLVGSLLTVVISINSLALKRTCKTVFLGVNGRHGPFGKNWICCCVGK